MIKKLLSEIIKCDKFKLKEVVSVLLFIIGGHYLCLDFIVSLTNYYWGIFN